MPSPQSESENQTASNNSTDPTASAQGCAANSTSAACRALNAERDAHGEASFATAAASKAKASDFNVPNENSMGGPATNSDPQGYTAASVKTGTIANNSGGGIPGSQGGSPASLGGGGRGGGSPGSPGYTTDILQGFSGSGGYSSPVANDDGGGSRGGPGRGLPGRKLATDQNGVDLRRFLPGGDRDPRRRLAGYDIMSSGINGKFVNIWNRISDRMQEKCRLGELLGCE